MKKLIGILLLCACVSAQAQNNLQVMLDEAKARLDEFNTERLLDSLDQEKLPKLVSGGVFGGGNVSNFIITRNHRPMSSYMRIGTEVGGFLDFSITKHFAIRPQVILTAHQNYFAATDTTNRLWSFGVEIPIYFLGRFGNMENGYIQFGGGIFTHFTYLSNVQDKYSNLDESPAAASAPRFRALYEETPAYDYSRLYQLHNNHFGVCVLVGYECPFGMIINASYKVSLSDVAGFYSEKKGDPAADALIYPQSVSLSIGYRWK